MPQEDEQNIDLQNIPKATESKLTNSQETHQVHLRLEGLQPFRHQARAQIKVRHYNMKKMSSLYDRTLDVHPESIHWQAAVVKQQRFRTIVQLCYNVIGKATTNSTS